MFYVSGMAIIAALALLPVIGALLDDPMVANDFNLIFTGLFDQLAAMKPSLGQSAAHFLETGELQWIDR